MANAKFSLNLNSLSNDVLTLLNTQAENQTSNNGNNENISNTVSTVYEEENNINVTSSNVSLPTVSIKGNFVDDKEAQLCVLKFTAFSAFPVEYNNGSYTMCLDGGANNETKNGFLSSGRTSMPESYNLIDTITEKQFKVGCAVNHNQGAEYLREFYPDVKWNANDFAKMANKLCITAEITVPISANSGKIILCKVVDYGPKNVIDLMGSFCSLNEYKDLFKVTGIINGDGGKKWKETNAKFLFADKSYNHITGEIEGYGPASVKEKKNKESEPSSLFKTFIASAPVSNQFFVRFFVDPSLREKAEKIVGHKLPDDFCKQKNISGSNVNNMALNVNTQFSVSGDLSEEMKTILTKPIKFSSNGPFKGPLITQKELRSNNSVYGPVGAQGRLTKVKVPDNYPLYYGNTRVKSINIHSLAADRLEFALKDIINHYGPNIQKIAPGCCIYGGSYNYRKVRGGNSWSIHSWGTALDFDAGANGMKTRAPQARLSQPIYQPFIAILAHYGFSSQGKNVGNDWMHFQLGSYKNGIVNPS